VPAEELIWQDPIPAVNHELIDEKTLPRSRPRSWLRAVGLATCVDRLGVGVTFRGSDKPAVQTARHSPRAPEGLAVNQPAELAKVLKTLEGIQSEVQQSGLRRQERSLSPT